LEARKSTMRPNIILVSPTSTDGPPTTRTYPSGSVPLTSAPCEQMMKFLYHLAHLNTLKNSNNSRVFLDHPRETRLPTSDCIRCRLRPPRVSHEPLHRFGSAKYLRMFSCISSKTSPL